MKYQDVLRLASEKLRASGVEEAQADAWMLFEYCTGLDRTHYFCVQTEEMPAEMESRFFECIQQRQKRIPLQHLTKRQFFCGLEFFVNEDVLIPRQDTECLVEEAMKLLQEGDSVLDLCTGSGCILLSLAKLSGKKLTLTGSDLSEKALAVARKNADRLQVDASFLMGDLFEAVEGPFDCIVSNPPYIATGEIEKLTPEVKDHEPFTALDGREDGLYFYRRIIKEAGAYLKAGGFLLFEIGYDQGEAVSLLMKQEGYKELRVRKDLAGLDRVVVGRKELGE